MKTRKSFLKKINILTFAIALFLSFSFINGYAAGTKQYKFTNKTGKPANDLHIEFDGGTVTFPGGGPTQVPAGTFADANGTGSNNVNLASGFTGAGVANGANVVISFDFGGGNPPDVKSWHWTDNNSIVSANQHVIGKDNQGKAGCYEFAMVPSGGNGQIYISIDGINHIFNFPPGLLGNTIATQFAAFVNSFPFGNASMTASNAVKVTATSYSGSAPEDLSTGILTPDSQQPTTYTDCTFANTTPTLPEWGLIIFGILLVLIGVVYLSRIM